MKYFFCQNNCLGSIDNLPNSLEKIICPNNIIEQINNLPQNLIKLDVSSNNLININCVLPDSLIELDISNNNLINELNFSLPKNLEILNYDKNKLTNLIYPESLKKVNYRYI